MNDEEARLRDYFAGQALAGAITHEGEVDCDYIAEWCYKIADAMIRQRGEKQC
jgi:hypothetical protein